FYVSATTWLLCRRVPSVPKPRRKVRKMGLPNAYCVRCRKQTDTLNSQTIVMANGARALQGHCSDCHPEVYKILEKKSAPVKPELGEAVYPDAFCVKCKTHTPALKGHTVILSNDRRALRGICPHCS